MDRRSASLSNATPQTIVFVGKNNDPTHGFVATSGVDASARSLLVTDTSGGSGPGFYDSSYTPFTDSEVDWPTIYIVVFRADDIAHLFIDGQEVGEGVAYSSWTNVASLFRVGGVGSSPSYDLSELRIYDRALDHWEIVSLNSGLRNKSSEPREPRDVEVTFRGPLEVHCHIASGGNTTVLDPKFKSEFCEPFKKFDGK